MLNKSNFFIKTSISVTLIISLFLINFTWTFGNPQFFDENFPKIESYAALAMEASTGRVLYYKNIDQQIFPASTTKILTSILAYENLDLDKLVTIPQNYKIPEGTKINVKNNEVLTVRDLLAGMLIVSGNDCAEILALEISGSLEEFSKLMNAKAKEIGCLNSSFQNPTGLPNKNHYTTARDMSKIANYFIEIPFLYELSNQKSYIIESTNLSNKRILTNTNRFFRNEAVNINDQKFVLNEQGMKGIKTGYTGDAGRCLVSSFDYDGQKIITLVFKSSLYGVYKDTIQIKNYIEANYFSQPIIEENQLYERKYLLSLNNLFTDIVFQKEFSPLVSKENAITYRIESSYFEIEPPIKKGDILGEATIIDTTTNNLLSSVYLVSNEDINNPGITFKFLLFLIPFTTFFVVFKRFKK